MIRTENTKRTLERKFWSSGWISLWVLAYSYERHWYLFSLFLRQKKVFVCFASICTISPCLKFLQGFYWKKKISSYLYTTELLKEHATFCKIKSGQRVTNRYMLHYLLPHLTARLTEKKNLLPLQLLSLLNMKWLKNTESIQVLLLRPRDEYLLGHLVTGSYICIKKNLNSPYLNWWKHDNSLWELRVCPGLQSIVILTVILIQAEDVDGCILFSSHSWIIF